MHVTHSELKRRLNYFAGLTLENQPFRVEKNFKWEVEPACLRAEKLRVDELVFQGLYEHGQDEAYKKMITTVPSLQSLIALQPFTKDDPSSWKSSLFERHRDLYTFPQEHLDILLYNGISCVFDIENKNYKSMFSLFPTARYLDFVKQNSLHSKLAGLYSQVTLLFEFVAVTNRGNTKPIDLVEMQLAME